MKHYSTVSDVIRTRPRRDGGGGRTVFDRSDKNFQAVSGSDTLAHVLSNYDPAAPAIVAIDTHGAAIAVLTATDLMAFSQSKAAELGGMIDFNDHAVDDVIGVRGLQNHWVALDGNEPLARAIAALLNVSIRAVVATEQTAAGIIPRGVILRAHRRY